QRRFHSGRDWRLLLALAAVALLEAVDAAAGVHDLVLAGIEGVGLARDFDLDQRIFLAVFPLDGFFRVDGRAGLEGKVAGEVLEHHFAVFGMNFGFHGTRFLSRSGGNSRILSRLMEHFASVWPLIGPTLATVRLDIQPRGTIGASFT